MMPILRLLMCGLVLFVCVSHSALATDYYVGQRIAGASDNNDGLAATRGADNQGPWKSLAKAASTASAGDSVWVYSGDYRNEDVGWGIGQIPIANSGDSQNGWIQFAAAPGQTPKVETILLRDKSWIKIKGFKFQSNRFSLPNNWQKMPQIVVDDTSVHIDPREPWSTRESLVRQKYATYMTMLDFFQSQNTNAIDIKNSNNIVIRDNTISRYSYGVQIRDNSSNIRINGNRISSCANGIFSWRPAPAIQDSIIENNKIRQSFNNGIMIREGANNVVIRRNDIMYSGVSHVSILRDSTDNLVYKNLGRRGGYYSETMTFPGSSAFNVHTSGTGNIFDSNYAAYQVDATGNDGNGFIADLMRPNAVVIFRNNIAYRNMGSGIRTTESPDTIIANNTLVENGYLSNDPRDGAGVSLSQDLDINQTIINNIFYNNPAGGIKSYRIINQQQLIENNLYYSDSGAPFIWDGYDFDERVYHSLTAIRENTSWERDGVAGDPLFVNQSRRNFRLLSASPAIDQGRSTNDVRFDADRRRRPLGQQIDIGAYESH